MKKIVVIGSNSFSGSDFIDYILTKGNIEVIGISRSAEKNAIFLPYKNNPKKGNFSFHQLDLNKDLDKIKNLLEQNKPEYIVNFAAQSEVAPSWEHPEHWFETNVVSLAKLGNYLKDRKYLKKYLHISSPEVYGTCTGTVREDGLLNPSTPYAASKAAADLFLFTLYKNFRFPAVFVRSTNVYGAHQQLFKIIPRTVISMLLGKKIGLHGGGKAIKSYIHIRDVSCGEYKILTEGKAGEIYHLSPDNGIMVRDLVMLISRKMKVDFKKATENVGERLGQDKAYIIDSSKIRTKLKWKPEITIEEGIDGVIKWVENNFEAIRKMPLEYIHKP